MLGLSLSLYRGGADVAENQVVTLGDGFVQSLSGSTRIPVDGTSVGMGALYDFQSRGGPPVRLGFKFVPGFDLSGRIDVDLAFRIADLQGTVNEQTIHTDFDYVLDFPLDLGIGVAWNPRRDVLVAADFEHRRFRDAAVRSFGSSGCEPRSKRQSDDPKGGRDQHFERQRRRPQPMASRIRMELGERIDGDSHSSRRQKPASGERP